MFIIYTAPRQVLYTCKTIVVHSKLLKLFCFMSSYIEQVNFDENGCSITPIPDNTQPLRIIVVYNAYYDERYLSVRKRKEKEQRQQRIQQYIQFQ